MTTTAAMFPDHGVDNVTGNRAVAPVIEHTHVFPGSPRLAGELQTHLVIDRQRADGHADGLTQIIDLDRVNPFGQQSNTFIKIGAKGARGEEAQ